MRVEAVKPKISKQTLRSAKAGAIMTGSAIALSQGVQWVARPDTMKEFVVKNGGKLPYARNLAMSVAIYTVIGAAFSALASVISEKIHASKPPKAVN